MSRSHEVKASTSRVEDDLKKSNKRKRKSGQPAHSSGGINGNTVGLEDALRVNGGDDEPSEPAGSDRTKEKRNKKLRRSLQKALEDGGIGFHEGLDAHNAAQQIVEDETAKPKKKKKKSKMTLDESAPQDDQVYVKQEHSSQFVMPISTFGERSRNDDQEGDGAASASMISTKRGKKKKAVSAIPPHSIDDDLAASSQLILEGQSASNINHGTPQTEGQTQDAVLRESVGGSSPEEPAKKKRKGKKAVNVGDGHDSSQSKQKGSKNKRRKDDHATPMVAESEQDSWDEQFSRHATSPKLRSPSSTQLNSAARQNADSPPSSKDIQPKKYSKFVLDAEPGDADDTSDSDGSSPASTPPRTSHAQPAVWQRSVLPMAGRDPFQVVSRPSNLPNKSTSSPQKVYGSGKKATAVTSSTNKTATNLTSIAKTNDSASSSATSSESDDVAEKTTEKKRKRRLPVDIEQNSTTITAKKGGKRASTGDVKSGDVPSVRKTKPSILEDERRLRAPTIVPTYSSGRFMPEEVAAAQNVLDLYGDAHDLTQYEVKTLLMKGFYEVPELWSMAFEALPNRDHNAMIRFMRRKFNNFERRGAGWTAEEDEELRLAYERNPSRWWTIAEEVGRFKEDCRDRYRNYLATGNHHKVKEKWTEEELAKFMEVIAECFAKIREIKRQRLAEDPRAELPSDYKLLHWKTVSDMMGGLRSRLQCRMKYLQLQVELEDAAAGPQREVLPSDKWLDASQGYKQMKNGDKYELLCHIRDSHAGKEKNIRWSQIGPPEFRDRWEPRLREYAWVHLKHKVPNSTGMKLQEILGALIRSYEEDYPQTLSHRFQNTDKGKKREEQNRVRRSSMGAVSKFDDDEQDTSVDLDSTMVVGDVPGSSNGEHASAKGDTRDTESLSPAKSKKAKSKKRQSLDAKSDGPRENDGTVETVEEAATTTAAAAAAAKRKQEKKEKKERKKQKKEKKERRKRKLAKRMRREGESDAGSMRASAAVNANIA